jgi:alpha,alpha-trehalase
MNKSDCLTSQLQDSLDFFDSEFFKAVQLSGIFKDSKTFADAIPKIPFNEISEKYKAKKKKDLPLDLHEFINDFFNIPIYEDILIKEKHTDINEYITALWLKLERPSDQETSGSLLPLQRPYVVPGGRFREVYYWDTYFTALGLIESNRIDLIESLLANFVQLQSHYGCIPNGNRSYYISRSQPPIIGLLVELLLPHMENQKQFLASNIVAIETEYKFWMQGHEDLSADNTEHRRVVKMPDGSFLNRYWDDNASPRPESYREDVELLNESKPADEEAFYRNIRAACESGWDFSSRWLGRDYSLASIRTTRILPIDLNCLLYKQEMLLSQYYSMLENNNTSLRYADYASTRKNAINRYMWSPKHAFFMDYDLDKQDQSVIKSLAGVLPLFVELSNAQQAEQVGKVIEQQFLKKGGLVTTAINTSQQWDSPNGWAPLHWFTVQGLLQYKQNPLAEKIQRRWLKTVELYFSQTGKLMEKYNVCQQSDEAKGGEYDVQEGFGWTNGVYQAFNSIKNER